MLIIVENSNLHSSTTNLLVGHTYFCLGLDTAVGRLQFFLELFGQGSKYIRINLQSESQKTE